MFLSVLPCLVGKNSVLVLCKQMCTNENTWSSTGDFGPVRTHSAVLPASTATSIQGSGPWFGYTDGGAPHRGDADGLGPGLPFLPLVSGLPWTNCCTTQLHTRSRHTHLKCPMPWMSARCQDAKNQWQPTVAYGSGSSRAARYAWSHAYVLRSTGRQARCPGDRSEGTPSSFAHYLALTSRPATSEILLTVTQHHRNRQIARLSRQ